MSAERAEPGGQAIFQLLEEGRKRHASDLHVEPGQGAAFRIFTLIEPARVSAIDAAEVAAFLDTTIDRIARMRLDKIGVADAVYADSRVGALRVHASRGRRGFRLAIRFLARSIPELHTLRLPETVERFAELRSGLILVAGPTGSGKSTTIASLIDRINVSASKHVITLEDPIEYEHRWNQSIVTQYEVGRDVSTFAEGVRGALRADPDVIFIGELRGLETVAACLQAAETGHVVFAALHTPSETPLSINRIVGLFPSGEQEAARLRLADVLRAIVGLRLLPLRDGTGLRIAAEVAVINDAARRIIRDGATHQLRSTIATSRKDGSQTLEAHLSELVAGGEIDIASARNASFYPEDIKSAPQHAPQRR